MPLGGVQVGSYENYQQAQRAVDFLSDEKFPVENVTIIGSDLRMVERVTGRLSYPRAALGGFLSGAWFGLFVGLLLSLFSAPGSQSPLVTAIFIGGAFGLLFSVITYSFSRGRRDFTSTSQIVASSYAVLCLAEQAHKARELLREIGGVQSGWPARPPAPFTTTSPSDPSAAYPPGAGSQPWGSPTVPPVAPPAPPAPPSGPPADRLGPPVPPSGPPTAP